VTHSRWAKEGRTLEVAGVQKACERVGQTAAASTVYRMLEHRAQKFVVMLMDQRVRTWPPVDS